MHGLLAGDGDDQRLRVGEADVLGGEDDHAPHDEQRVLAGLDHAGQPVERGVGVGAAQGLDEGADRVVVGVALAVVEVGAVLQRLFDRTARVIDGGAPCRRRARRTGGGFEGVEGDAGVAADGGCERLERVVVHRRR